MSGGDFSSRNLDDLLVSQPDSGEEALTICETLARSNALNRPSVEAYKAALRREGFFGATPPPDRMLVKALNYNLAFVPDLLALFQVDPRTGRLTRTDTTVGVGTPVCVQFLKAN